jgi:hypothetical protein
VVWETVGFDGYFDGYGVDCFEEEGAMSCCVVRGLLGDGLRTTSMLFLLDIDIDYMGTF